MRLLLPDSTNLSYCSTNLYFYSTPLDSGIFNIILCVLVFSINILTISSFSGQFQFFLQFLHSVEYIFHHYGGHLPHFACADSIYWSWCMLFISLLPFLSLFKTQHFGNLFSARKSLLFTFFSVERYYCPFPADILNLFCWPKNNLFSCHKFSHLEPFCTL